MNSYTDDIPAIFQSYILEKPFQNCIACETELMKPGVQYVIEKVFRDNAVELEFAMCVDCMMKLRSVMSKESMQRIQDQVGDKIDFFERNKQIFSKPERNTYDWISNCMVTGKSVTELSEYAIYGHCEADRMVFSVMPYMVSLKAAEEVQELLSAKTKEELDRFMDENLGLPPEWKEIFKRDLILI